MYSSPDGTDLSVYNLSFIIANLKCPVDIADNNNDENIEV